MSVINKLESYLKQLAHPFYKRVDDLREEVKREALEKAAEKYPEPFNPASWTSRQLAKHAMAENYDQGVYITGLYDKCIALEVEVEKFKGRCKDYEKKINELHKEMQLEAEYWRLRAMKNAGNTNTPGTINKPKYADLDD